MTEDDHPALDPALAALFAEEADEPPSHLEPDRLLAYLEGSAAGEERELLRAHLADCPRCVDLLLDLEALTPEPREEGGDRAVDLGQRRRWRALRSRLAAEATSDSEPARHATPPWYRLAAAVLLLATVGLGIRVAQLRVETGELLDRVATLEAPRPNVPVAYLDALRSADGAETVVVEPGDGLLVLMVSPSEIRSSSSYELVIEDARGDEAWRGDGLEISEYGSVRLALSASTLPAGSYRVHLFGVEEGERRPAGVFALRIEGP